MKISVLIPTYNEAMNIEGCLQSVAWADEVIVLDSFSEDNTVEIAKKYTEKVYQHEYINSANQKNWALDNIEFKNKWLLIVDADERCTPELQNSIESKPEKPDCDGYWIYRQSYFMGKRIKHCGWDKDKVLRLFRRDKGRYEEKEVHAKLELGGKEGVLEGKFEHYTYRYFESYFEKFNRYTTWGANDLYKRGKKASIFKIITRPTYRFIRTYIFNLGLLDGVHGLILSTLAAFSVFTKYIKCWQLQREEKQKNQVPEQSNR